MLGRVGAVVAVAAVALWLGASPAAAAVQSGEVTGDGLLYLGKFCFDVNKEGRSVGIVNAHITTQSHNVFFALFDDSNSSWYDIYGNKDCDCNCWKGAAESVQEVEVATQGVPFSMERDSIYEHTRPRFWYAALISCNEEIKATYNLEWTQADGNQFGFNEMGLFPMYLIMFFIWAAGLLTQAIASRWLWRARTFHPIVKLFTLSVGMWTGFTLCSMLHWAVFAGNGIGVPFFDGLARVFEILGRVTFLLLAMLLAKGWTISSTMLTERGPLLAVTGLLLVVYLILAIWDIAGRNPASTVYVYDSAPGVMIVIMHLGIVFWFGKRCLQSYREEAHTEKRRFYKVFGIVYSMWFLSLPVIVLVGSLTKPWYRQKVVETLIMVANTVWYFGLGFLLWPSRATTYFEIQTDEFAVATAAQYEDL